MSGENERDRLVKHLVDEGYVKDPRVIQALRTVPRELFVSPEEHGEAYSDRPLQIGQGQTISAPHMVAIMMDQLGLRAGHKVLEIGTGSGYHAAVAAELVQPGGEVVTVEVYPELAQRAQRNLRQAGTRHVYVLQGDGGRGAPNHGPFDRIYLTCAAPEVPPPLFKQLRPDGWILAPLGQDPSRLVRIRPRGDGWFREDLGPCAFVPLTGEYGWQSSDGPDATASARR